VLVDVERAVHVPLHLGVDSGEPDAVGRPAPTRQDWTLPKALPTDSVAALLATRPSTRTRSRASRVADVALHPGSLTAESFDGGVELQLAAPGDEDVCPFVDESFRGGQTDAGRAAGDDGRLACEKCHMSPLIVLDYLVKN
jgi:hypothetical protein